MPTDTDGAGGTEQLQPARETSAIAPTAAMANNIRSDFEVNIVVTSPFTKTLPGRTILGVVGRRADDVRILKPIPI